MKILLDHHQPFRLAHGGLQLQIERTRAALLARGVEVEPLRWWDVEQRGDLIHFYGVPSSGYLHQAGLRRVPVVLTPILSETCNRPRWRLRAQGFLQRLLLALPGGEGVKQQLIWRSFRAATHHVVGLNAEQQVLQIVHRVPPAAISVVPLGVTEAFLNAGPGGRAGDHLICPGTITDAKNPVLLAETARAAQVPVLFVGRAFTDSDPCWLRFRALVDGRSVRHHPHVEREAELIALLHGARGFVLASRYENWSLAAHEAAACGLPLLLPDQPWSRERFGAEARYWQPGDGAALRRFHAECAGLPAPCVKLFSWADTAAQLQAVYEAVLRNSR